MSDDAILSDADILRLWPTCACLARDMDLPYQTVKAWQVRNSIPAIYWDAILISAGERQYDTGRIKASLNHNFRLRTVPQNAA